MESKSDAIYMCANIIHYMFCANILYNFKKWAHILWYICMFFYYMLHMCANIILNVACACTLLILYAIYVYCILCVWIIYCIFYMCIHVCVHIHMCSFFSTFNYLLHYRNRLMMDFNIVFVKNVLGEWVLEKVQLLSWWRIVYYINTLHFGL